MVLQYTLSKQLNRQPHFIENDMNNRNIYGERTDHEPCWRFHLFSSNLNNNIIIKKMFYRFAKGTY